jgi:LysM repeat protein
MSLRNSYKKSSKIKLSESLQIGVAAPTSQSTFFKIGGGILLVLSLAIAANIFYQIHSVHTSTSGKSSTSASSNSQSAQQQQVLGAYSQNSSQVQTTTYTVQKGDTLFNIAQSHGLDWQVIAVLNNLTQPYELKTGEQLKLPSASQ